MVDWYEYEKAATKRIAELEAKLEASVAAHNEIFNQLGKSEAEIDTLRAKVERLESLCQEVVEAKDEYKRFNSTMAYDSAFAAYDRMHDAIDKLRKEGE